MSTLTVLPRPAARIGDKAIRAALTDGLAMVGGSPGDATARAIMASRIAPAVDEQRHALARLQRDYLEGVYSDITNADIMPEPYAPRAVNQVLMKSWYAQTERYADVELMHPLDRLELEHLPGGISEELTDEAIARFIDRATAQLGQHSRNAAREAVIAAARKRGDGWQRVMVGETCAFCALLVSRGAVYSSKTVRFKSHANCDCGAAIVKFSNGGESIIAGNHEVEKAAELREQWQKMYKRGGKYADASEAAKDFGKWYRKQTA